MIHLDPSRPEEAIEAGWRAYAEHVPGMEGGYRRAAAGWRAIAVCSDAQVIGALLARGGIIHLGIVPEWRGRWASRRIIRDMLSHGKSTMLSPGDNIEFLERIRRISWAL